MSLISYVNKHYLPHSKAHVHIEDRGYQFADGVYEVIACYNKNLIDMDKHCKRLQKSLDELNIQKKISPQSLTIIINELLRRNGYDNAYIYLQITRGVAKRNHAFPQKPTPTSLVITVSQAPTIQEKETITAKSAITQPDIRWDKCHIKSISLLPNILAKQVAVEKEALETIMINKDGYITEGSASNVFIITKDNKIITHPATPAILGGITRDNIIHIAKENNFTIEERLFTLDEAKAASEIFISSTTKDIAPINKLDDTVIGNREIGETTQKIQTLYLNHIKNQIHT